ncbi:serine/threonine-protein kinase [Nannocystis sp.]|uniref:serine/threonine-protein kinase n=1 Tax=Nannocystis sp. TaxID=1962667 RepID=UPI0025DDFC16|nr:serine/threonine-protein kinase [Nannocystis sp.]MBK7827363.1 serine/threonine protein kinase [Nannocystis sp.]
MRTDAILPARAVTNTSSTLASGPTEAALGLAPIDQVRRQVSAALFGPDAAPTQVGRFQVQRLLGAGGMGVVFAAHDPQLGRTVALKLLQPMSSDERARERLLREAQAMARLQHPNVIGVHETGVHGDQVYVVMEYVEEGTLADWLRVHPRSWQETVDMLIQAGEGLAAAHAAGLVHRDFKPANILVGGGRARISDFGLARAAVMIEEMERTSADDGSLLTSPLTRTGALLGTPAYMAPEQIRGEAVLASSDQFAFAIVLYEALFGHRPFLGASIGALVLAIDGGQIARPSRKVPLPSALFAVIRRASRRAPRSAFPICARCSTRCGRHGGQLGDHA